MLAALGGRAAVTAAVAAALAQLYLLFWAGKTVAALAGRLLQTRVGVTLAAVQTAIMLALSFAGWVPVAAWRRLPPSRARTVFGQHSESRPTAEEGAAAVRRGDAETEKPRQRPPEPPYLLLACTALLSKPGGFTGTGLVTDSGLRRDLVHGGHRHLMEASQAQVKAQPDRPSSGSRR
ncbi:hypothetical protein ACWGNE_01005 [Streptomyces xiamenensis]